MQWRKVLVREFKIIIFHLSAVILELQFYLKSTWHSSTEKKIGMWAWVLLEAMLCQQVCQRASKTHIVPSTKKDRQSIELSSYIALSRYIHDYWAHIQIPSMKGKFATFLKTKFTINLSPASLIVSSAWCQPPCQLPWIGRLHGQ